MSREFAYSVARVHVLGLAERGKHAALHFGDTVRFDLMMRLVSRAVVGVVARPDQLFGPLGASAIPTCKPIKGASAWRDRD